MGKTAVIIDAGTFPKTAYPRYLIKCADIIVCCDSAFGHWLKASPKIFGEYRHPDLIIGDMDSLSPALQKKYATSIVHESEQDNNDQTKAVRYIIRNMKEVDNIHILGATGKREDHTVGNMGLLMEYSRMFDLSGISIDMVSDHSTIFAITDSQELYVGEGRAVSIFSPDNSLTIKSEGLKWQTEGVVFDNWWPATLNKAEKDVIKLTLSHPSRVLIVLD